jgi:hypothetical protein
MRLASLASSLLLVLTVSTHVSGQTDSEKAPPPAWELRNAAPGVVLTLEELRRRTRGAKQLVDYRLVVSGLPKDKTFKLWSKSLDRPPDFAFLTVYHDSSGDLVFEGGGERFKEVKISLSDFAKGEPIEYALISTDQAIQAYTRVVLFPIEAKDGPCVLSVQLGSRRGDVFLVMGQGFEPEGEVTIKSHSEGEVVSGTSPLSRDGKFATVVTPAVRGKRSGKASFTASGKDCSPTVDFEWGPPALRKQ